MATACISSCVDDARVPVRATYVNLYKWPESDAEFVRSVSSNGRGHPRVVDSISCRQLYLRSYTFSRKESVTEKTKKRLERVKDRVAVHKRKKKSSSSSSSPPPPPPPPPPRRRGGRGGDDGGGRKCGVLSRALLSIFRRLLSCTTKVDVAD